MEITGKRAVVTGGASGIGRALCERFHAEGAQGIAVVDRDEAGARAVAEKIGGLAIGADVSVEDDVRRAVEETEARLGPIDIFCSNAGVLGGPGGLENAAGQSNSQWERCWGINVMAHVYGARAVLPGMLARGGGTLVNVASAAGLLSQVGDPAYSATKHAAVGFAESLAITHGDQGIRVLVVCPQAVESNIAQGVAQGFLGADVDGVLPAEAVAEAVVRGLREERFLVLVHPQVKTYFAHKAADYDRWVAGMRKLRRRLLAAL